MEPRQHLTHQHRSEAENAQTSAHEGASRARAHQQAAVEREFASAEDLLRADAAQTPVPPAVGERLAASLRAADAQRPWWRRLLRR